MEKLINMTDFVLEQRMTSEQIGESSFFDIQTHISKYYDTVFAYAEFLKQPLTLGIFVPCDYNGNVLEKPHLGMFHDNRAPVRDLNIAEFEYKKAKEKVLFEGFVNVDTRMEGRNQVKLLNSIIAGSSDTIQNDFAGLYFYDCSNEKSRLKTIEDLLKFQPLKLTESAIKQIFGDT